MAGSTNTSVSGITLNGAQIMSGATAASATPSTVATAIATQINLCTFAKVGACTTTGGHGYTATVSGSAVTLTGLSATANSLIVTDSGGGMTFTSDIYLIANAAQLTNFANWYSYYRDRMLMMKTAAGRAFSTVSDNYRVGFLKFSSSSIPTIYVDAFCDNTTSGCAAAGLQRTNWYNALYSSTTSGSTPTRTALSDAGRYFAHKLSGTDPMQYSCQQNFAILSTDGYWNSGDGKKMDGTTIMDNQDGIAARPMYDGTSSTTTWNNVYVRNSYSTTTTGCPKVGKVQKSSPKTQPQAGSCTVTVSGASCTPTTWSNSGTATTGACTSTAIGSPYSPASTGSSTLQSSTSNTVTSGGSSNTLADVAMYYYQTDLRTTALSNCTGALGGTIDVCGNNVFTTPTDNNTQQHLTTFTLGLGASGWMNYSSSYLTDTTGSTIPACDSAPDYVAVKLGCPAKSTVTPPVCSWQTDGTSCDWPLPGMTGSDGFIANVDDLWHAAVNGRGAYFSATNPATLSGGLSNALSSINSKKGSAAAAATSTLNPVPGDNFAYVASYTTVTWKGNLEARGVNVDTAAVNVNADWCVENVVADPCTFPELAA